jgi:hypothetical protein
LDDYELAKRAEALPGLFADRLSAKTLASIREYANVGEWTEEVDLLLAALQRSGSTITAQECRELQTIVNEIRKPDGGFDVPDEAESPQDRLDSLGVTG